MALSTVNGISLPADANTPKGFDDETQALIAGLRTLAAAIPTTTGGTGALYGVTAVTQPTGVTLSGITHTTGTFGFATAAEITTLVAQVKTIATALVGIGAMKGGA